MELELLAEKDVIYEEEASELGLESEPDPLGQEDPVYEPKLACGVIALPSEPQDRQPTSILRCVDPLSSVVEPECTYLNDKYSALSAISGRNGD